MPRRDVREIILDASLRYVAEYGCKFSIDEMVKSLDMSKRTFYRYFVSKEVLLMALVDVLTEEVQETMRVIGADERLSIEEKLTKTLTIETRFEKVISFQQIPILEKYYPAVYQYLLKQYELDWSIVEELLKQGMKEGIYKEQNIDLVKNLLLNGMQMLCRGDFLERNRLTYQEGLGQVVQIILLGIRADNM